MRAIRAALLLLTCLAAATAVGADARAPVPAFQVIVNSESPITTVERKFLADLFLKKATQWPHLEVARPVDLRTDTPARRAFSEDILRRSVAAVKSYWQQSVFSGREVPPPELESDAAVVQFVLRHRGAVGYVSGATNVGGARILTIR